ncbi:hypothetical protein M9H77_19011 [Catharanthus roseus]|uniref:Uncharacterized protein n=1 Tax=Catharanthus roseus TaxID=4058 RepID=A0ACC0B9D7_CATRO|nr:hypothetical protein M9H77_19011 [Catharanthus roseus]
MGRLVAKQPNALFLPINKGHGSLFLVFFLPKIEESSSDSAIYQLSSKSVRFDKKLPSPQVNTLDSFGLLKRKSKKASSFTKQDDESSITGFDNKAHCENLMYESSMAEVSTASSVLPVMMTRTLSTEEQLANLTRLVEGLAKHTQEQEYSIAQLMNRLERNGETSRVDGSIISMKECQAHVEIPPTNEDDLTMPLTKVEPVKALDTLLKGFIRPTEDVKMEGSKNVKMLDTSSKDFDKLLTSRTSNRFDSNAYRLLAKASYNSKSQSLLGKLPQEASRENGNSAGLRYKCASPIRLKIKRATT